MRRDRTMSSRDAIRIESVVERKHASLPRFVVVPSTTLAEWQLSGTTVVEVQANGVALGRRNLKHWGKGRDSWFVDLTQFQCDKARVDTGDKVLLDLRRASTALPEELSNLIAGDPAAAKAWQSLSQSRQRQVSEHVRAARHSATRRRRATSALVKCE